jgi:hypothetical protein
MKTNIIFAGLMICSTGLFAQVEHDDMYFKKKDRTKLNEQKEKVSQEQNAQAIARGEKQLRFDYPINTNQAVPNQSNMTNPEFIARSQSEMVATEEQDYFVENYQYTPANSFNNFNNNLSVWNASQLYNTGFFAPQIYGWNSPYYSPFNDPYLMGYNTNPWCNPSFQSGWSVSFSYGWGNNWNYGWGNPYNNMMWGNSMWAWGGNPYYGYGYGNGFYNGPVIIIDNGNNGAVYGKRSSRANNAVDPSANDAQRSTRLASYSNNSGNNTTRIVSSDGANVKQSTRTAQAEYYTPQWRRVTQQPAGTTTYGTPQNRVNSSSGNSSYNNSNATQRSTYSAPAQRSSSPSYSAPTRSSSSGSSGGSSSSPSRSSRGGN